MLGRFTYYIQRFILKKLISPQRQHFDDILIPRYALEGKTILFIGVEWYNQKIFQKYSLVNWVSIDPSKENRKFGAKTHIRGEFPEGLSITENYEMFDVVFCNGVYGWGVNSASYLEDVMQNIASILKSNGLCIFGYNTEKKNNPLHEKILYDLITKYLTLESEEKVLINNKTHENHIFCLLRKTTEVKE